MKPSEMYVAGRSNRGIFVEIYFPKKAAHQAAVLDALHQGLSEKYVKEDLRRNLEQVARIMEDHLADANRSETNLKALIRDRVKTYKSPFTGWSIYSVDGAYLGKDGQVYEEGTLVVRLMFRFRSKFEPQAKKVGCRDVLRSMFFWNLHRQEDLVKEHRLRTGEEQLDQFLLQRRDWPGDKKAFAEEHFVDVLNEIEAWKSNCGLFVFGYLIRTFCAKALAGKASEEEILITAFWDLAIYVVGSE